MLSKRISSIGLFTVREMTENPTAKNVKFWFSCNPVDYFWARKCHHLGCSLLGCVISVKKNVSTEI